MEIKYDLIKKFTDYNFSYTPDDNPISQNTISDVENKIKENQSIINFANFFGDGLDLKDETIILGTSTDYIGYIPKYDRNVPQEITITHNQITPPEISKGIAIHFHKYTCQTIYVAIEGNLIAEIKNKDNKQKVFIPLKLKEWDKITIGFSDFYDNQPICIKGVVVDGAPVIEDIYSFDSIAETNPISDDLAINECNVQFVSDESIINKREHKIIYSEYGQIVETHGVKKINEEEGLYEMKTRSILENINTIQTLHSFNDTVSGSIDSIFDWNKYPRIFNAAISEDLGSLIPTNYPEDLSSISLSAFLKPCSARKYLQQLAWASCCGIDTTYTEGVKFVPFFAVENATPIITINNSDDRILKTSVTNGKKYKELLLEIPSYLIDLSSEPAIQSAIEVLGSVSVLGSELKKENGYTTTLIFSEPCIPIEKTFYTQDVSWQITKTSPYACQLTATYDSFSTPILDNAYYGCTVKGIKYSSEKKTITIPIAENGETLTISNQELFPIDMTNKIAQLKKWYSADNVINATIVDDLNEIRLGSVVKIQLRNNDYFQGIVTKLHRTTVSERHVIELEAHEWN